MLNYLWEDTNIFNVFVDKFIPHELLSYNGDSQQKHDLLDCVVNYLFIEPTS